MASGAPKAHSASQSEEKPVQGPKGTATVSSVNGQVNGKPEEPLLKEDAEKEEVDRAEGRAVLRAEVEEADDEKDEIEAGEGDLDQTDSYRRKRDREGSLEPSHTPSKTEALPTKKNRLQSDDVAEATCSMTSSPPRQSNIEGEKVGHIRKRVQDLSWKQRKEGGRDDVEEDDEEDEEEESGEENEEEESVKKSKGTEVDAAAAKAKSNETQPVATQPVAPVASVPDTDTASTKGLTQKSPPLPPARTQPTFSSFSKSSSPFNSATASIAGPSWLAGKSSGSGGLKPSALGSMPGSNPQSESGSPGPSTSAAGSLSPAQGSATGKSLGFGAFAASNPFAAKGGSARTSSPVAGTDKTTGEEAAEGENGNSKSFDEALREGGTSEERDKSQKVETQLDKGHADLRTGEEGERTVASVRAKLFIMADDKSWKERGTGMVRCNVPKGQTDAQGARLVMRSEGVLRLILNIKLFKGMKVNLEQEKFLRLVAFEDEKPVHYAIRIGNASTASQFYRSIQEHIPTQGDTSAAESLA